MLSQGLKNQDAEVSIPNGYPVSADITNIIKIQDYEDLDTVQDIKLSRIINVPAGYTFVGKFMFNAETDDQIINIYVQGNSSSQNNSSQSSDSSSTSSTNSFASSDGVIYDRNNNIKKQVQTLISTIKHIKRIKKVIRLKQSRNHPLM